MGIMDTGSQPVDLGVPDDSGDPGVETLDPDTGAVDANDGNDETLDSSSDSAEVATLPDTGVCTPPTPLVCDPVKNTGCNAISRCDVSDTYNTGVCVDLGALGAGASCTTSGPFLGLPGTDTCNHGFTCQSGKCIALCYCNTDCPTGQCCNVSLGANGFSACGGC
jgi:hypothetical protein